MKIWKIEITSECEEALMTKIQLNQNEDCGILFASQISDNCIRVNSISNSCSINYLARKNSCSLDIKKANDFIIEEYEKSNHTRFYIGEWHTHPEDNPHPSFRDIRSLKESYKKNHLVISNLILMAIVGRHSICWKMFDGVNLKNIK